MVKTRGLKEAKKKLGDIEKIISNILKEKKKIKIFESGCGYGKVMVELKKKFGDKIDIIGMNLKKSHGDKKKMISFALEENIITKDEIKQMQPIKIIFGDADKRLPFKTNSIDLIYSQTSSYLYKDKMHFYEEVSRVLNEKGVARITLHESRLPKKFFPLLKIYKGKKLIPFEEFIKEHKNIKLKKNSSGGKFIEIRSGGLNFNLKLKSTLNLNKLDKKLFGIQSIYSK